MANSDIDRGAQYLASLNLDGNQQVRLRAAARQMGMSEQEALRTIARANKKLRRRGADDSQVGRVVDQFIRRAAGVEGINDEIPQELQGIKQIPNSQVESGEFGNQDELQNFGGINEKNQVANVSQAEEEISKARGRRDSNVAQRGYFDKASGSYETEEMYIPDGMPMPERFKEDMKARDFGVQVPDQFAPARQVLEGELARLQQGIDQYGADAFPGAADVAGRIEDDLYGGRGAEQALARELVKQDRLRQNSAQVEANNWRAQAAANIIGQDFVVGGRGAAADQAMENIGNIAQLGPAKVGYDFQVSNNPVERGTAIPNALPLNLPDQYNAPATDNRFVGPLQRQEQWLVDNAPGYKEGKAFGDYPQVAIGQQLGAAQAAIEGINFGTRKSPVSMQIAGGPIRNLDDLQAAVDQAAAFGQQRGVKFYDYQDGKNVYVGSPGISEVLQKGGMNENQRRDLARGLFAAEAARRNPANQVAKNFYQAGMGQPGRSVEFGGNHPALGGGMVQIAQLGGEKINGQEVRGKLQALTGRVGNDTPLSAAELADARMPLIGGVAGQDIPRARFVKGDVRNMTTDQIYERFGPVNGQIANAVIQRYEQAQGTNSDGFGIRVERQRNMDPGPTFDPGPDPWSQPVGTGNGITQEIQKRSSSNTQKALPYGISTSGPSQGPTRPLTTELKNELAALSSGYSEQGPRPASNYSDPGIKPDGPSNSPRRIRQEADYRQSVRNLGRIRGYGRNAAIAGGGVAAIAGIDGLINGERNKREEAQY